VRCSASRRRRSEAAEHVEGMEDAEDVDAQLERRVRGRRCHWEIVRTMADTLSLDDVSEPADRAVEIQRGHIETVPRRLARAGPAGGACVTSPPRVSPDNRPNDQTR
jgi:hypothetical protein